MTSERALALLERENPIDEQDLPDADYPEALLLRERILLEEPPQRRSPRRPRRLVRTSAAAVSLATVTAVALLVIVRPGGTPVVEDASAAVRQAAAVTAASAQQSGTAAVRITHGGELWAEKTIRWSGDDLSLSDTSPGRDGRAGAEFLLVDGTMYGIEDGVWVELGSPESIDPDSGTTPDEYLAAVREDVGGTTLRRLTESMTGLTTTELDDGATVYSGSVAARLVARESGFKEDEAIRVLPFGYVAHGAAADPAATLDAAVTVGADGVVRDVTVTWGTWAYRVAYSDLGATPKPKKPAGALPLLRDRSRADG